nr:ABC transporter substrate-binding protein [Natrinema versiforme]
MFDDERVRRVVSFAIDRETITESLLNCICNPAVSPSITEWANPDPDRTPYDPDRARRLLSDAGWTGGVGGPRIRDGTNVGRKRSGLSILAAVDVTSEHDAVVKTGYDLES